MTTIEFDFDGATYIPEFDESRLKGQWFEIYNIMKKGYWMTLGQLNWMTGIPTQSISARLRDFRKPKFGGHTVLRRRCEPPEEGVWEYKLQVRDE